MRTRFQGLRCASYALPCKSIRFKQLRTLFLSCRSFSHSFPLFSMVCGLFCKIPGGGGYPDSSGTSGRDPTMAFHKRSSTGDGSKRESRQVHVAAGEDYAQLWSRAIAPLRQPEACYSARLKERSNGYSRRGFNDDFHSLPDGAHGSDHLFFAGQQDPLDIVAQNGERSRCERGPQAVSNGIAGLQRLQLPASQRTEGVIGPLRFTAKDLYAGTQTLGAQTRAAEQPASAHRREHRVEVRNLLEEFLRGGGLASNDLIVVKRVNQRRPSFRENASANLIARGNLRLAKRDFAAICFDGAHLHARRVFGHHDEGGNTAPCRSASNRSAVVAARLRDDAARRFLFTKRKDCVAGATNLEGARSLEVFTFEEKASAGHAIKGSRGQYGRAVYARLDASMGVQNSLPGEICVGGSGRCCAHWPLAYYGISVISRSGGACGTTLPYREFHEALLLDRWSSSVTLLTTLSDQQPCIPSWPGAQVYGFGTPPSQPLQHAHFAAFSRHESRFRQERAFHRSSQYFARRIFLRIVSPAPGGHAHRLHAAHAGGSDREQVAGHALHSTGRARAERAIRRRPHRFRRRNREIPHPAIGGLPKLSALNQ